MSITIQATQIPHLGGITANYAFANGTHDPSKPTCVLITAMSMNIQLFKDQFNDAKLTDAMNLLAIEPLGHGGTTCASEHFTYWDSAQTALQVIDKLGIQKVFALGVSQGGWIVTRMALLAPDKILGLMLLGTSLDSESPESRDLGSWNPSQLLLPFYDGWSAQKETPGFVIDDAWCGAFAGVGGFGPNITPETVEFWTKNFKDTYKGDESRKKVRMALICLLERDGLLLRVKDIACPVHWLQGTDDYIFGTKLPADHITRLTSAKETELTIVPGGAHYLNTSSPGEVNAALLAFVTKHYTA
ncbi:hypothetical protein EYB26_008019 [Talaromyces marneffei]|uniref:Dihydrolipoyllysine-residue acetyltransferase component of acetoin cleaving system n=1 Tax=Talaromyces marneffei PM1 TaxID=1077442 RepID=A0A093VZV2_TALMA|nr:uncharacterized protein EYB26_008019 [Talaromyces marneffei]QGA20317.1 hypothetical protein EYB26_008019 [Talaromyces marneffei]